MAEYIEREAALNASKIVYIEYLETDDEGYLEADCDYIPVVLKRDIMTLPAADVRPVVLCRECKWTKTDEMDNPAIYCMKWDRWEMPPDGFCWLGQKRGDRRCCASK